MPTTARKPAIDTKAVDQLGRRTCCPDRHHIEWPDAQQVERDKGDPNWRNWSNQLTGGLCSAGDRWSMTKVMLGRYSSSSRSVWRLKHEGNVRESGGTGQLHVGVETWLGEPGTVHRQPTDRSELQSTRKVSFNCAGNHYSRGWSRLVALGRAELAGQAPSEEALRAVDADAERPWPPEIAQLVPDTYALKDTVRVRNAILSLEAQGWQFDARIMCPLCIEEDRELEARLAQLRQLDVQAGLTGETHAEDTD